MDILKSYGSDGDSSDDPADGGTLVPAADPSIMIKISTMSQAIVTAPDVATHGREDRERPPMHMSLNTREVFHNPKVEYFTAPIQGPLPEGVVARVEAFKPEKTTLTGYVDHMNYDALTFDENYHTYANYGFAQNPTSASTMVGSKLLYDQVKGATVFSNSKRGQQREAKRRKRYKRKRCGDIEDIDNWTGSGWCKYEMGDKEAAAFKKRQEENAVKWKEEHPDTESESEDTDEEMDENARKNKAQIKKESTQYHGEKEHDYQGRTYIWCSPEYRPKDLDTKRCYIPKRHMHTWKGHEKGVNSIKWFPKTGHLLLSCSNDSTIRLWDVYNDKRCLRTYQGHDVGVRDIDFSNDGKKFLSTSYDKWLKVWDTEYGKVISRHTSGSQPFDGTFYPRENHQFLCGQRNKMAVQWDTRSNHIVQRYEEHLGAVNCVTFIDNNRRFLTTSDDKKIFIWDYGIPVVINHISEPNLQSVPRVATHPNGKWFAGQSMDNQIVIYGAMGRFRQNKKKHFKGHLSAGYACQVGFSPCGTFLMSGDAQGRVFFWDWKTSRTYRRLHCHDKVCIGAIWHPVMASKVATCSWDCTIKLWD